MWLLFTVCLPCVFLTCHGQDRATFRRGNDRSGRCQYSFTVDSPAEASCPASSATQAELDGVKSRLAILEALVGRLAGPSERLRTVQHAQESIRLRGDNERLERGVRDLQLQLSDLQQEAERLRARPCQPPPSASMPLQDRQQQPPSDSTWTQNRAAYQELKAEVMEVSAPQLNLKSNQETTGCGELVSVGEPHTHRRADGISGKYGVWLQDPEPTSPYGPKTVWRLDTVGTDVRQLFAYEDMEQLARGFPTKVLLLPEPVESTGATMYRGSLYYQRRRSRTLLRYDLASENIAARRDLPHAGFHGQYPYSWGGYTDVDLAVDEQGLWVIYSTSKAKGAIMVSQLDHHSLEVRRSWETNIRKNTVANAFMICGRLYTLASYSAPNTTINYAFDTASGQTAAIAVPFQNHYRYTSMLDYNHASRKLYAWDNFHMVSYDVQLSRPDRT